MLKASSEELASGLIINRSLVIILLQLVDIVTKSDSACSDFTNIFNMYDTKGFLLVFYSDTFISASTENEITAVCIKE